MSFTSIPILDLSLSRNPETKPAFLDSLRHALLEVGFFYISNTGIDESLIDAVITQAKAFFALPLEKKLEIEMKNVPSFLANSATKSPAPAPTGANNSTSRPRTPSPPTAPLYHNLLAPNQWPDAHSLPLFRPVYETYIHQMSTLSTTITTLIALALGLPPTAFSRFFDTDQQHKLKIIKYPDAASLAPPNNPNSDNQAPNSDPHPPRPRRRPTKTAC
ncbi:MAG: hypothetical protein FRX48_01448 [Lasallia pustulata]|uniref:Non-haem dioxygenase N-terminal domain-containing protein n=1 Tax=Lasallia pustulata TaxID=136370 RepID=A0A5M8Q0J5_9LECA|nr:MAG: hypothetical protein FRX48_01448 [Lasallia pustulata]